MSRRARSGQQGIAAVAITVANLIFVAGEWRGRGSGKSPRGVPPPVGRRAIRLTFEAMWRVIDGSTIPKGPAQVDERVDIAACNWLPIFYTQAS
jgi:hypothetical protein